MKNISDYLTEFFKHRAVFQVKILHLKYTVAQNYIIENGKISYMISEKYQRKNIHITY